MKRTLSVASTATALLLTGLITASPASASDADRKSCINAGSVCVWQNSNYSGSRFAAGGSWGGTCANSFTYGHSVANGWPATIRFYSKDGCSGSYFDIRAHDYSSSTPFAVHSFKLLSS
ncbi:peptidase inhibitor family I36 protein [Streptomyces sp. enrichment culture]|uniref:peptidase inhibitor family I36 protein n=1 Tax=Streptomyces sp. enrichment culture TaxID=1795815 RepID=UPI003F5706E4